MVRGLAARAGATTPTNIVALNCANAASLRVQGATNPAALQRSHVVAADRWPFRF